MKLGKRLLVSLLAAAFGLGLAEVGFRLTKERFGVSTSKIWQLRAHVCDGRSRFQPKAYIGWVFEPGRDGVNSDGFLDHEFELEKPPGGLRIACLGGSTTAGNLFEGIEGTYPQCLEDELEKRLDRPVDVMNWGIPGWTTAESLTNYFLRVQDYEPDLAIIHHSVNDTAPRVRAPFRSDYTNYRHPWEPQRYGWVRRFLTRYSDIAAAYQLETWSFRLSDHVAVPDEVLLAEGEAVLTPETVAAYRRNIITIAEHVQRQNGQAVLMTMPWNESLEDVRGMTALRIQGMIEHNQIARDIADGEGYGLMDLAVTEDEELRSTFVDLVHFTPSGNRRKAGLVADFLVREILSPDEKR